MSTFRSIGVPNNPTICVELDYTNDPTDVTETWTDVTPYLVSYSRSPVRSNEFDQPGPAAATLVLRNDDNRFLPDNTAGPYYGGLKKYRRFRVMAKWAGVTYNRFWGYAVDWPQSWAQAGKDSTVTLQLADALTPLQVFDLEGQSISSTNAGFAIQGVLDLSGIHSYDLDDGISVLVGTGVLGAGSYAAQLVKDMAASENGVLFADGTGTIKFHDRHHRLTQARSLTSQATIGDLSGEVPYVDPTPMFGDVWATVNVTPYGGTVAQSAFNAAASTSYFNQTLNFPPSGQYLVSSTSEALAAAQYLGYRYADPVTRVPSVTLVGTRNSTLWPTILGLDTSDLVTFKRRQSWGTLSVLQFVEGYGEQVTVGQDWRVSLALSGVDPQSYWLAGDSRLSLAGQTTRGGY
jgi:hypothetical protein